MTVICKGETVAANTPTGQYLKDDGSWNTPTAGMSYTSRGDPNGPDFDKNDLVYDNAYHDLDLSAIVSAGASQVTLFVKLAYSVTGGTINVYFGKNGNSNDYNMAALRSASSCPLVFARFNIECDTNRVIQYKIASGTECTTCDITVCGWWI